jgi:hypothetical protein
MKRSIAMHVKIEHTHRNFCKATWRDPISRPKAPVFLEAGGDDTTTYVDHTARQGRHKSRTNPSKRVDQTHRKESKRVEQTRRKGSNKPVENSRTNPSKRLDQPRRKESNKPIEKGRTNPSNRVEQTRRTESNKPVEKGRTNPSKRVEQTRRTNPSKRVEQTHRNVSVVQQEVVSVKLKNNFRLFLYNVFFHSLFRYRYNPTFN